MTRTGYAAALGVSATTLRKYESGDWTIPDGIARVAVESSREQPRVGPTPAAVTSVPAMRGSGADTASGPPQARGVPAGLNGKPGRKR